MTADAGTLRALVWPTVMVGSGVVAVVAMAADLGVPVQPVVVCWFVLVCPGLSLVRPLRLASALWEWTLAVALSMALAVFVAQVMLASDAWSPSKALVVLLAVTVLGSGVDAARSRAAASGASR